MESDMKSVNLTIISKYYNLHNLKTVNYNYPVYNWLPLKF